MSALGLVVFDVDGTLVDSQADIVGSMTDAFASAGLTAPARADILGIVGLSLPEAMAHLAPDQPQSTRDRMVDAYKDSYVAAREAGGPSPLYPGVMALLETLSAREDLLLGVATGKSRRGLDALFDSLDLRRYFVNAQVSDSHPSKPHPAMLHAALSETGCDADRAVMIGDTAFDMEMAAAAGMRGIGVTWGYHPRERLAAASVIVDLAHEVEPAVGHLLDGSARG